MNSNLDYLEYRSDDTIEELRNSFHIYDINPDIMAKIYDKKNYYSHDNVSSFISNWPITKTIITLPEYLSLIEASLETGTYSIEPYKDIMFKRYLKYCSK